MPYKSIILEKEEHLAIITLNKPDINNAFDEPMMEAKPAAPGAT